MKTTEPPLIIAEFRNGDDLSAAARDARKQGFDAIDALTPCPVEGLDEILGLDASPIRWPMLIAALVVAGAAYGLEFWSAVYAYPIDSGGRPLNCLADLPPRALRSGCARGGDRRLCRASGALRPAAPESSRCSTARRSSARPTIAISCCFELRRLRPTPPR